MSRKLRQTNPMRMRGRLVGMGVAAMIGLALALPTTAAALSFSPGAHAVGANPQSVAIGDLNGDGKALFASCRAAPEREATG